MSEGDSNPIPAEPLAEQTGQPEDQQQRWLKYGSNVLLTSVVVIVLAFLVTYMAQSHDHHWDTTVGGSESLRPQTVSVVSNLKQKFHIVALYPKLQPNATEKQAQDDYQPVVDLLNEYSSKTPNITTEVIDPDTDRDKVNKLIADVTNKYGGEVKDYKAILDDLSPQIDAVNLFCTDQTPKYQSLPGDQIKDQDKQQEVYNGLIVLSILPRQLEQLKNDVDADRSQPIPTYKDAVDEVKDQMGAVNDELTAFGRLAGAAKSDMTLPKEIQDYMATIEPKITALTKSVGDYLARFSKLGEITELNEFKDQLKSKSIIIMGDNNYKILQYDQVWQVPENNRIVTNTSDTPPKLRFIGEQQISMALASLAQPTRKMVVFVRSGQGPLTVSDGQSEAPFGAIAQRLKDYNFDVEEKDLSGQPPNPEAPQGPEPSDEQLKDAIWVVLPFPTQANPELGAAPPSALGPALQKHLAEGGSALVLENPGFDSLTDALADWGITVQTDRMLVHESLPPPPQHSNDIISNILQSYQAVFVVNHYCDDPKCPLTIPLEGLDFLTGFNSPVVSTAKMPAGVTVTPLLPIPRTLHSWATDAKKVEQSQQEGTKVTFTTTPDPGQTADVDNTEAHPLYGAALAEKAGSTGRLVVVGSYSFGTTQLITMPDSEMLQTRNIQVARLPGNAELFTDSIFWLGHEDSMLAISPQALQVARIKEISSAKLAFWRIGVLTIGLPLLVILSGLFVYSRRRD
jgi:hypothetical protein